MSNKLKQRREELAMTQEELAKKSGVSRGTICALEKDENKNATTGTLAKLAVALNIRVEELFT